MSEPASADANIAVALCVIVNYRAGAGLATHSNARLFLSLWLPARHLLTPSRAEHQQLSDFLKFRVKNGCFIIFVNDTEENIGFLVRPVRSVNTDGSPLVMETLVR